MILQISRRRSTATPYYMYNKVDYVISKIMDWLGCPPELRETSDNNDSIYHL